MLNEDGLDLVRSRRLNRPGNSGGSPGNPRRFIVAGSRGLSRCNSIPGYNYQDRVHWELWAGDVLGAESPSPEIRPPKQVQSHFELLEVRTYNPVYAVKLGIVSSIV